VRTIVHHLYVPLFLCLAGCATERGPFTIAFPGPAPAIAASASDISSYDGALATIAAIFEQDLRFPRFTATLELFPGRLAFERKLLDVGYDPALAERTARVMAAIGGRGAVLIDADKLAPMPWPDRVALLAHELTHTLQYELGGGIRGASEQWLREGFAEWVAMRVLDRLRVVAAVDYRNRRLRELRATSRSRAPRLEDMAAFPQFVTLASRDDIAPYAQAFLSVDALIERHGMAAVIRYFALFAASQDRTGNFTAAFGEDLPAFERWVEPRLWR
jgi:hypothetical protein